MKTFAVVLLSK